MDVNNLMDNNSMVKNSFSKKDSKKIIKQIYQIHQN